MTKEIELIDIIPTNEQVETYAKHIYNTTETTETIETTEDKKISFYKITNEEATNERLNEYFNTCDKHNIEHDVLLSALIHSKIFEIVNEGVVNGD